MSWSFPLFRVFGTQLRVHVTFFLIVAWVGIAGHSQGGWSGAMWGIALILALFTCVVLHEFGHVLTARYFGIRTPDITLLPIGGVARLERMPRNPLHELLVALAGPAVNVVIAATLFLFVQVSPVQWLELEPQSVTGFFVNIMVLNAILAVFNMIPAFPMDGGRVLRALLALVLPYAQATSVAASLGQALAFTGGLIGFLLMHPLLILVAFFIFIGAGQEAYVTKMREVVHGVPVLDAIVTRFRSLEPEDSLHKAVDWLLEGSQVDFPVIDADGHPCGLLTRSNLMRALRDHGSEALVRDAMSALPTPIEADESLEKALIRVQAAGHGTLPVIDPDDGHLVGLLTPENIGELIMVRSALENRSDVPLHRSSRVAGSG